MQIKEVLEIAWLLEHAPKPRDADAQRLEAMKRQKKAQDVQIKKERARQKMRDAQRQYREAGRETP